MAHEPHDETSRRLAGTPAPQTQQVQQECDQAALAAALEEFLGPYGFVVIGKGSRR